MSSIYSYPKIWNMGHPQVRDLLNEEVLVEEKIDGSQFSFGVYDGELRVRSKGVDINPDAVDGMFVQAVETARSLIPILRDGWTYRAEYLQKPKHNVLAYDRTPTRNLILFDVGIGLETWLTRGEKEREALRLGLEVVPCLYLGKIDSLDKFYELLATVSVLGGQKIEGVVVKNYQRFGIDGKTLMGKFVSEAFKEVHNGEWRVNNPTQNDIVTSLVVKLKTPARWHKAVQHLKEAGKLEQSPKDIGMLIREVPEDILAEEESRIKDALFNWAWPHIRRGVVRGLPEWYKNELLAGQFSHTGTHE